MRTYIALLRAINVGGRKVVMSDVRELAAALGFAEARTLLQSGNLVFRAKAQAPAGIERQLERAAPASLGLAVEFFVRTADEWAEIVAGNPFRADAKAGRLPSAWRTSEACRRRSADAKSSAEPARTSTCSIPTAWADPA